MCRVQALLIALDRCGFLDAWAEVWREARRRGVLHLSAGDITNLDEWVSGRLLVYEAEFRPSVLERRAIVEKVAADIERCEARWGTI